MRVGVPLGTRGVELAVRALAWLETLLCPRGQYEQMVDFALRELDCATRPDPLRRYARDACRHLRRHGLLPLIGATLVGLGTALYGLVNASLPQDIAWPLVGFGLIAGLPAILPGVEVYRGGCPYLVSSDPVAATPRRVRPRLTAVIGLMVCLLSAAMPVRHPLFDGSALLGVLVSGSGIVLLAEAERRRSARVMVHALYVTAAGALLVGFGDGGWGIVGASRPSDAVASVVTGVGGVLYALTIGDLVRCFQGPPNAQGQRLDARGDLRLLGDERAA